MSVERDVILDLLPLYVAGEASPASRALVEAHLKQDPALEERVRVLGAEGFTPMPSSDLPAELELETLRRAKRLLDLQRWLFGLGIAMTAIGLSIRMRFEAGRLVEANLALFENPFLLGVPLVLGLASLTAYLIIKRRLQVGGR